MNGQQIEVLIAAVVRHLEAVSATEIQELIMEPWLSLRDELARSES